MTLVEYLKMRRQVETASPVLVKKAEDLALSLKLSMPYPTTDILWDALIQRAEELEKCETPDSTMKD